MIDASAHNLRAELKNSVLYRIINSVFALLFIWVLVLGVLFNTEAYTTLHWYGLALALVLDMLVCLAVSRCLLLSSGPGRGAEIAIVCILMLVFQALQIYVGTGLQLNPEMAQAPGMVADFAASYAKEGAKPAALLLMREDNGAYVLLSAFFSLLQWLGVRQFSLAALVLNMVVIDITVVLTYLCCRRVFGPNRALLLLLGLVTCLPLVLRVPLCSTDTLALPFPVAMVLLWLGGRNQWRMGNVRGAVGRIVCIMLLAAVGALIKTPVLLVWLAIMLDMLALLRGRGRAALAFGSTVLLAALVFAGTVGIRYAPMMPTYNRDDTLPERQWVMMGLSGKGVFNEKDYGLLAGQPGLSSRKAIASAEIRARMQEYGFGGIWLHVGTKLGHIYGDGTLDAAGLLGSTQKGSIQEKLFTPEGAWFNIMAYVSYGCLGAVLCWMVVGALKAVVRGNNALSFVRVALLGTVVYQLVMEGGARHVLFLWPLYVLCAIEASPPVRAAAPARELWPDDDDEEEMFLEEEFLTEDLPETIPDYMDPDFGIVAHKEEPAQEPTIELFETLQDEPRSEPAQEPLHAFLDGLSQEQPDAPSREPLSTSLYGPPRAPLREPSPEPQEAPLQEFSSEPQSASAHALLEELLQKLPQDPSQEPPQEPLQDFPQESLQELPQEFPQDLLQEFPQEPSQEPSYEPPQELPQELPPEPLQEFLQEPYEEPQEEPYEEPYEEPQEEPHEAPPHVSPKVQQVMEQSAELFALLEAAEHSAPNAGVNPPPPPADKPVTGEWKLL